MLSDEPIRPQPKPERGGHVLKREEKRHAYEDELDAAKKSAKQRDLFLCRWPEKHKCRGLLEGAHIVDASLGGEPVRGNLISFCAWIHRRGPRTIHSKHLKVEPETDRGSDGPCAFYRRETLDEPWSCVGVETAIHRLRKN